MKLKLDRYQSDKLVTIGRLYFNDETEPRCVTLEDAYHPVKIKGKTRIPSGTYEIQLRTEGQFHARYLKRFGSDFHKGMLELQDVPNYKYILIHIGNFYWDSEGCLLVGAHAKPSGETYMIANSLITYKKIYPPIAQALEANEKVSITINDNDRNTT